jgi:hypothetical protein
MGERKLMNHFVVKEFLVEAYISFRVITKRFS